MNEKQLDYTNCISSKGGKSCADVIAGNIYESCQCLVNFTLTEDFKEEVFVYYGLSNFYQNHRRYVKSRDDKQLLGLKTPLSKDCEPFKVRDVEGEGGKTKTMPIAPCGAIANSLFNDTFTLMMWDEKRGKFSEVRLLRKGIAWATDRSAKFRNPSVPLPEFFQSYAQPPNWRQPVWKLDKDADNNGFANEALIVWMRTAALPTFRKLYARVDHSAVGDYQHHLPSGKYQLRIDYSESRSPLLSSGD